MIETARDASRARRRSETGVGPRPASARASDLRIRAVGRFDALAAPGGGEIQLAATTADLKSIREDIAQASQEVEKNKSADLERKAFRDAQAKQWEDTIKELQKDVQACREKIARLEGSQPANPDKKKADEKP